MNDHEYSSSYYGTVTIKCTEKVWNSLQDATCNLLAALINGDRGKVHQTSKASGNPGDGAEGYVHNYSDNQIASFKDVEASPKCVTVLKVGDVKNRVHRF